MARDIVGVPDAVGIEQAYIIGSSIGAEVGLGVAAHYPKRVLSLAAEGALYSEYGPYGTREADDSLHDAAPKSRMEERKAAPEKTCTPLERSCRTRSEA